MTSGRLMLGALALAVLATSAATSAVRPGMTPALPSGGRLYAFGGRDPVQTETAATRKLDGMLVGIAHHTGLVRANSALADLHALNPAARFLQPSPGGTAYVAIDAVTRGDPQQLKAALVALGLKRPAVFLNDVGGWLPVTAIEAAAARAEVHSMRAALARRRAGAVTSQGDFAIGTAAMRSSNAWLDGTGVTVGVLSDSFNCYQTYAGSGVPAGGNAGYAQNGFTADAPKDMSTGDLPSSVKVLQEADCPKYGAPTFLPDSDEGRAMLQIVHDLAPGASLAFNTALPTQADFANGITALAAAGAKVIADDVGYFDEPFFQDGLIAQAIDQVESQGVVYMSAAGNDGAIGYDNLSPQFGSSAGTALPAGELALNFDTTNATTSTSLPVTLGLGLDSGLAPGEFLPIVVEWDQPFVAGAPGSPGATSHIDLCVSGAGGLDVFNLHGDPVTCTGPNATGDDPVRVLIIGNPANAAGSSPSNQKIVIVVGLADGTAAPHRIKVGVFDNFGGHIATITSFATNGPTIQGHPGAAGAMAIGAAFFAESVPCGTSPTLLEFYSSTGGDPILFDATGKAQAPVVRQKPDVVGPDGVNNTFLGVKPGDGPPDNSTVPECATAPNFPAFFGTSGATPHAAAAAALLLQANPTLAPADVYAALRTSAVAMTASPPDFSSGYGFIDAGKALTKIAAPPAPNQVTYNLSPTTINLGQSATLNWEFANVTGCTASGAWSGSEPAKGSQTFTPTAATMYTYTLTCTNLAGEAMAQQTLTVLPASSGGGGGGGALDVLALLALTGAAGARVRRRRL
jgi:hypothetical protein